MGVAPLKLVSEFAKQLLPAPAAMAIAAKHGVVMTHGERGVLRMLPFPP